MRHTSYISQEHNYASKYNKAVDGGDAMEIRKSTNLGYYIYKNLVCVQCNIFITFNAKHYYVYNIRCLNQGFQNFLSN